MDPRSVLGSGDVKYHIGATGDFHAANGQNIGIHLVSNPSHLEAVDPVAIGRARAKQTRIGEDGRAGKSSPIIMHGDAAFAGQGICAETLNMAGVAGFTVGGSVHIIVNNLIGFTTVPRDIAFFALFVRSRQAPAGSDFPRERGRSGCRRPRRSKSRSTIAMHSAHRSSWT